jgi:hypothetical protein
MSKKKLGSSPAQVPGMGLSKRRNFKLVRASGALTERTHN